MEKIKKALEQARKEREGEVSSAAQQAPLPIASPEAIQYTKTQSIDGSIQQMREKRIISAMDSGEYEESLKILSTQVLQRMVDNDWSTLAVTSPRGNAGKTTIAINLGLSIAREVEYTVMVVDANLRAPSVHDYFGLNPKQGLSDYLLSDVNLSDVLVNPKGINHFVILPGGATSTSSAELLGSPRMNHLVDELKNRYEKRIIIFDTPSVLDTADTLNFLPSVDAALLVIEDEETTANDLKSAIDLLTVTDVIGTVLNKS